MDYTEFAQNALEEFNKIQDRFRAHFKIDDYSNWFYDQATELLTFSTDEEEINFKFSAHKITSKCDFYCNSFGFYLPYPKNHIIMSIEQLGESIKKRRKELNITQPHLAELAQISTNTLYKLERGQGNPSLMVLYKLSEVLGLELKLEVKQQA